MIAGLDTPSQGCILIDGRDVTHMAPAERRISMVFQSYALFPHLSVAENILFGVKVHKAPAAEHARRLARVADPLHARLTAAFDDAAVPALDDVWQHLHTGLAQPPTTGVHDRAQRLEAAVAPRPAPSRRLQAAARAICTWLRPACLAR
jgi:ABC-type branched-subunit amino acid transport system ATPase component